jgi:hypothetical protein
MDAKRRKKSVEAISRVAYIVTHKEAMILH